jgi:hypothetical protein
MMRQPLLSYPRSAHQAACWLHARRYHAWRRGSIRGPTDLLYVATTLENIIIPARDAWMHPMRLDLIEQGVGFRCLNAQWYGWLYHRVQQAARLAALGRVPAASWSLMEAQWSIIREWAYEHLPAQALANVERSYPSPSYRLPVHRASRAA